MENEKNEKKRQTIEEELAEASLGIRREEETADPQTQNHPAAGEKGEDVSRKPRSRRGKPSGNKTGLLIGGGILVGAAVLAYGAGAVRFRNVYFPNTVINGIEAAGFTAEEIKEQIASALDGYSIHLTGREGTEETVTGEEIRLHTVFDGQLEEIMEEQNPLLWGIAFFQDRNTAVDTVVAYDENAFEEVLDGLVFFDPDTVRPYQKESLSDYISGRGYELVPADPGTEVSRENLDRELSQAVLSLQPELSLEETGCYVYDEDAEPDPELIKNLEEMNRYAGTVVTYTFGSRQEILDGETIHTWISLNESGEPVLDETGISEYVSGLAKEYNTSYTTRTFMTSYGREVKVAGVYGWRINQAEETAALTEIIRGGESQTREPVYSLKGASHDGNDYGNTYAEVNLTAQHMFFYKDGKLILESDFVSGNVSKGYTTPPGLFSLTYKQRDAVLRGEGYASPVDFWMPFNGGIGFHDASWRSQFGGTIYKTNGSHGCINMPHSAAKTLYENVYAGMPVICYNLEGTESKKGSSSPPAETQPVTTPAETQPATVPAETQPVTVPAETQPVTTPAETQPVTVPAQTEPATLPSEYGPGGAGDTGPSSSPGETEYGPGMNGMESQTNYGPGGGF